MNQKICPYCNKPVTSRGFDGRRSYGSSYHIDCRKKYQPHGAKVEVTCSLPDCDIKFWRYTAQLERTNRHYHSKECRLEALRKGHHIGATVAPTHTDLMVPPEGLHEYINEQEG